MVLDGPFCISYDDIAPEMTSGDFVEASPDPDRFSLWWQIEVNGQVGWYPENVGQYSWWLWETDGMFPRWLALYYMVPNQQMAMAPTCPTPGIFAGQTVQPGFSAMNLRSTPNGDVIGRVEAGAPVGVFGEPTCAGGTNWWQTGRGGFIAENDPESGFTLLVPYVPPTAEPTREPEQPTAEPTVAEIVPTESEQPTEEPERPTEEPTREPERPTEVPTLELELAPIEIEPTRPARSQ